MLILQHFLLPQGSRAGSYGKRKSSGHKTQVPAGRRRTSRALKWQGHGDVGTAWPLSAINCVSYATALKWEKPG